MRPYSPSSCPVHVEDGLAPKSARPRGRRCGLASVGWIGVQGAHLHRWRISNLGASPPCMAPWRQGAELLPRMNPCRRSWTSLNILLQPTKPFSWYSVSRGGVNLILQCYGRITDEPFIKISLSAPSQKLHIRLNYQLCCLNFQLPAAEEGHNSGRYFTSREKIKAISPQDEFLDGNSLVHLTKQGRKGGATRPYLTLKRAVEGLLLGSSYAGSLCAQVISGWSHHGVGTLRRETHNSV